MCRGHVQRGERNIFPKLLMQIVIEDMRKVPIGLRANWIIITPLRMEWRVGTYTQNYTWEWYFTNCLSVFSLTNTQHIIFLYNKIMYKLINTCSSNTEKGTCIFISCMWLALIRFIATGISRDIFFEDV